MWCFFCGELTKLCRNAERCNWSASKAWQVWSTKNPKCQQNCRLSPSHHCPLWHEHCRWGIDIPGYTFGSKIQARAIPPPSWRPALRWLQITYSFEAKSADCNGPINRPTAVKWLDFINNEIDEITIFNSTENALFDYIWLNLHITAKKVLYLRKSITLAAEFNYLATSGKCAWPINRSIAVKGLRLYNSWGTWYKLNDGFWLAIEHKPPWYLARLRLVMYRLSLWSDSQSKSIVGSDTVYQYLIWYSVSISNLIQCINI